MGPQLIKSPGNKIVDLGNKIIKKYTPDAGSLEINHMTVTGRHPEDINHFVYEEEAYFMIYILKGYGQVTCDEKIYELNEGDVLTVPPKTRFAVSALNDLPLEYLVLQTPPWTPAQGFIVDKEGNVIEDTQE